MFGIGFTLNNLIIPSENPIVPARVTKLKQMKFSDNILVMT